VYGTLPWLFLWPFLRWVTAFLVPILAMRTLLECENKLMNTKSDLIKTRMYITYFSLISLLYADDVSTITC
jgi:hypothetical protein